MITSLNICYHRREDLLSVVNQVVAYPPDQVLIQVFSGVLDLAVIRQLLTELRELLPGRAVIGTSTAGEIMSGEAVEGTILVNFSLFEQSRVRSALVTQNEDLAAAGYELAAALNQKHTKALIILGCGLKDKRTINGEPLLKALDASVNGAIIAGGQAGDNGKGERTFVFTEAGITEHGVAAASVAGEFLTANNTYNLSWVPIGKKLTITEAKGPRVYSIDGQSPYAIYAYYLGQEVADNLPLSAADFPLIIERDGMAMAIHATGVNEDGSFNYIHDFYPGEQLRFGFCHAGLLALGAQLVHSDLRKFNSQAVFVYSCVSRKWILGADIAVELSSLSELAPSAGFFSYGEYYQHANGRPYFFSQTMTVLSLTEGCKNSVDISTEDGYCPKVEESKQFRTMRVLHRLIDLSTREIESMNIDLAKLANRDFLTGLANRRHFDEILTRELKRHQRSQAPLSLIMIDVDHFKRFNDTYGHVSGDDCLRAVALVFRNVLQRPVDTVARYGGEEFCCVLPGTGYPGGMLVAEKICRAVEGLEIPHAESDVADRVTVSLGMVTLAAGKHATLEELLKACDRFLYQAKEQGRNMVVGGIFP